VRALIISAIVFCSCVAIVYSAIVFFAFPLKYKSDIQNAAAAHEVDAALIASVIRAESGFRASAVSHKGAVGLMQIMPATAEYIATRLAMTEYDLSNPEHNIRMGTYYLKYLHDKFGDVRTALMAYNAGEGNVTKWLDGADKLAKSPFPETNKYVEKVLNGITYYKFRI